MLSTPSLAQGIIKEAQKIHKSRSETSGVKRLEDKIVAIEKQIYAVAEHLTKLPSDVSPEPIFIQMRRLEEAKKSSQQELEGIALSERMPEIPAEVSNYQTYLNGLKQIHLNDAEKRETQSKIIQRLIHKIEVLPDSIRLHYYASDKLFPAPEKGSCDEANIFLKIGSNTLDRSGPSMNRTCN